ncbi:hypothetical protein B484DRAFT_407637 [Ochromonadaceae sp. CCMP2298]|nr:hypothetical protein B484DRAFT_407637 [Ochromonadaceae sp. CCMP2298]
MTSALRIDGAAYLAFYMRLPLRRVKRGSEDRWERRPVKNIECTASDTAYKDKSQKGSAFTGAQ